MRRRHDKYGRGSAAANGAGFVDLEPGDTFSGLEARLRGLKDCVYKNAMLGVSASVGSMRNANELAKHLGKDEDEEAHKFAAKNVGVLFANAGVGIRHLDKEAVPGARWIVTYVRVFSCFVFAGKRKIATITLKENKGLNNLYSVEAVEINEDADSERTPRGAMPEDLNSAPFQNLTSQLESRVAYYVGDVNRTRPSFLARSGAFSVETAVELIMGMVDSFCSQNNGREWLSNRHKRNEQTPPTKFRPLTEVVETVAKHQAAGFSPSTTMDSIVNSSAVRKGTLDASSVNTDITVIILIGQERIHLKRCIERLVPLQPKCVYLIESQPDDGGVAIAKETAAKLGLRLETMYHKWPGFYAKQFNWALEEVGKSEGWGVGELGSWVLRLDADEYLTEETCARLRSELPKMSEEVAGLTLELKRRFCGGEIRHATNGIRLLRIWRAGRGRSEERAMDEHIEVDGKVLDFDGAFYDDNLNGMDWWRKKHRGYAKREAMDALALFDCSDCSIERLKNPSPTDRKKIVYYKLPRYVRAVMYFCIRYFLKGGFLDGYAGWMWNFWQGLWYRWMVDREIGRMRDSCDEG